MKITREMKIRDVLAIDKIKMIQTLVWLAPEFERLRNAALRKAMGGRVSVEQAARVARIPLTEMLYVLNLAAGEDERVLAEELRHGDWRDFEFRETNPPVKPFELLKARDSDENVKFVDLMPLHEAQIDPLPEIEKNLKKLKLATDILLLRHPFDPIPLRDLCARKGFSSWAEERAPGVWYIYFYRPAASAFAIAEKPIGNKTYLKSFAAAAAA